MPTESSVATMIRAHGRDFPGGVVKTAAAFNKKLSEGHRFGSIHHRGDKPRTKPGAFAVAEAKRAARSQRDQEYRRGRRA